jgi:hypothetical protein
VMNFKSRDLGGESKWQFRYFETVGWQFRYF